VATLTTQTTDPYKDLVMPADDSTLSSAIRRLEERVGRDPSSLAFAHLADLYRKTGRSRDAVTLCRQGLARYPHYTTARLILAKALLAEGELDQALGEVQTILDANPGEAEAHRLAAEVHRRLGRLDTAVEHLEAVVRLDPADREARALLALLAVPPAGEPSGLGRILSDDTFATVAFGTLCVEQGLGEEAVQVFARIIRKDPDNADARTGLEAALRLRLRRKG
jgi:Flp pilus assembly protein TadD